MKIFAPLLCLAGLALTTAHGQAPLTLDEPAGQALVERMRAGGLVLFFRHADTSGMDCDSRYLLGERNGQRHLSEAGREQAQRIGAILRELDIPVQRPVLAGPVFRARDTAELAFGPERVEVSDSLLADDYASAGRRSVAWVIAEHRRLFGERPAAGSNRILIGHRTPGLRAVDDQVGREELTEGAAIVLEPARDGRFDVLGVIALAPVPAVGTEC
jgi:hypothetical protein